MKLSKLRVRFAFEATLIASIFSSSPYSFAQTPFYQGKTITILQGTEPGGSSDMMTKAMLAALKKHIPGEPTIISVYMGGGGGIKAANHIFRNAKPDGITIGRIGGGLVANAALEKGVLYDLDKLIYLGSTHSTYHWVFITRREADFSTLKRCANARRTHRRPGGRPFQLFRRPSVCLADRPQRAKNARWLLRQEQDIAQLRRN